MNAPRHLRWSAVVLAAVGPVVTGVLAVAGSVRADEPRITATSLEMPVLERPVDGEAAPASSTGQRALSVFDWRVLAAVGAGCIVLVAVRLSVRRRTLALPPDVFEVLGAAPLAGPHAVRIVRFGPKTLLVGVSSTTCTTLAELTDPQATACIAAACRGAQPPRPPRPSGASLAAKGLKGVTAACLVALTLDAAAAAVEEPEPADVAAAVATDAGPSAVPDAGSTAASSGSSSAPSGAALPDADGLRWLLGPDAVTALFPSVLLLGVVSLAPAVLLMTTCFVRISIVLAMLRQGLGTAQIPSNQILAALAIFLSALVMWPVWTQAWRDGVEPFRQGSLAPAEAFDRGSLPVRRWMATQIEAAGNRDTMLVFLARHPSGARPVATYDDVPVETLLPAFLVSELDTAFTIGFRLLLPFLILDLLVATLVVSTGLVMLPPTLVSLPLKLLVFIAADGWTLVVQSLLDGVRTATS